MTPESRADVRLDPRLRRMLELMPQTPLDDVADRAELLAEANSPAAVAGREAFRSIQEMCDTEDAAPSAGLSVGTTQFVSDPDGNTVNLQVIGPDSEVALPGVYYIHGGGMAAMSCYDGMYRGWGKHIAANGVVVAMVDFRNCVVASSAPEVLPSLLGSTTACRACVGSRATRRSSASTRIASSSPARVVAAT